MITGINHYLLIRYGVIIVRLVMIYSAIRGLWKGKTRGYYADHTYSRNYNPGSFYIPVSLRGVFALITLSLGFLLPRMLFKWS